jgi:uncharacterized protein (TIGR04255 family)
MSTPAVVEIRPDERFENLPRAPIVEAVVEIRARTTQTLGETSLRSALEPKLAGYLFLDSVREYHGEVKFESGKLPSQNVQDVGWKGIRFRSSDQKHIAQFNRDGFALSRLEPYLTWEQLESESQRLWNIYKDLAQPAEIQRLGLRFINRIKLPPGELLFEDYIQPAPSAPHGLELPFHGFMHKDTLAVPGHPFAINVIRTIQQLNGGVDGGVALILDIDVFTTQGFDLDEAMLERRLLEMRWLKNKVFFGSTTKKALEMFR